MNYVYVSCFHNNYSEAAKQVFIMAVPEPGVNPNVYIMHESISLRKTLFSVMEVL